MKITLDLVVDAIGHCSNEQERDLPRFLESKSASDAGNVLLDMISDHIESIEEDEESDRKFEADFQNPSVDGIHSDRLRGY